MKKTFKWEGHYCTDQHQVMFLLFLRFVIIIDNQLFTPIKMGEPWHCDVCVYSTGVPWIKVADWNICCESEKNSKTNLDQGSEESEKSFARNLKTVIANLIGACCINQLLLQWVWEDQRVPILTNPATWTSNTKSTQNCDDSTFPLFPSWIWNWEHCLLLKLNLSWVKRLQGSERRSCIVWF